MHALTPIRQIAVRARTLRRCRGGVPERTIGDETGFIMMVTILVLAALLVLIVAVSVAGVHVNATTTRANSSDEALGAANAGLQVALFRLDTDDVTTSSSASLGTGGTYNYTVTSLASSSSPCTGLWVQNASQPVQQVCITSVGTVDGVNAQVQERVAGYTAQTNLFPVNGVFAINGFSANDVSGSFDLGSDGVLGLTNANLSSITGELQYLSGDLQQSQNSGEQCTGTCVPQVLQSKIAVPTVGDSVYAAAAATNNDTTAGDVTYTNASYSTSGTTGPLLTGTNNNATVSFAPGTYYYCGINVGGFSNFAITTNGAGLVKIYIDSSYDTSVKSGGNCPSGEGNIYDAGNSTVALNSSGTPSDLQLYFYGDPGCTTSCPAAISPMNGATFSADIFAPYSSMTPGGVFTMSGDLVVGELTANNSVDFTYVKPTGGGGGSGSGANVDYFPAREAICTPASTPTTGSC